jgi:hypothetical protein
MRTADLKLEGTAWFDLTDSAPDRWRNRLASLPVVPDGARAVVVVGALAVEPEVARLLAEHAHRLVVDVWGQPVNVRRWLDAVRAKSSLW